MKAQFLPATQTVESIAFAAVNELWNQGSFVPLFKFWDSWSIKLFCDKAVIT